MKHTRENQGRPLSQLNIGQVVVRLGNKIEQLQGFDQKIEQAKHFPDVKATRDHLKNLRAKRKLTENEIDVLKRRLAQLRAEEQPPRTDQAAG
ncbi:MAG: hypothetical protein ABSH35_35545 [Isosphaeraceae bacterium]|jgi:ribosome-interacting GTPase 1